MNINNSAVEDPNSEVVKQIVERSDGTKVTIENKSNNPTWRGNKQSPNDKLNEHNQNAQDNMGLYNNQVSANQEQSIFDATTFDQLDQADAVNNYYGDMNNTAASMAAAQDADFANTPVWDGFDAIDAQNKSLFEAPMGDWNDTAEMEVGRQMEADPSFFDVVEGYPRVVQPLDGTEELRSNLTDDFYRDTDSFGNPMSHPEGLSYFESDDFENAQDIATRQANRNDDMEWEEDEYKYKYKDKEAEERDKFMSKYIVNAKTEEDKELNSNLVWDNASFGDKVIDSTSRGFLEAMSYIVPSEEFVTGAYDLVTDPAWREEISDWAKEEPLAAAAAVVLAYKGRKAMKALPKKYQDAVSKFAQSGKYEARIATQVKRIEAAKTKVTKLTNALGQHPKGSKPWTDANIRLIDAKQKLQAAKNVQKALKETKKLNTGRVAKTIEKIKDSGVAGKVSNLAKNTSLTTLAAGGIVANSIFDNDTPKDTSSDESVSSGNTKPEVSKVFDAMSRLEKDKDGAAIAEVAQRDTNTAQMIVNNQGRIKQEYGDSIARDLFTVAVGALAGFSPLGIAGSMGDKMLLEEKQSRDLELQGLKDQAALNKEALKQQASFQKDAIKAKKDSRDKVETDMTNMISVGGLKGGKLRQLKDGVLKALITADNMNLDYAEKGVQMALVEATKRALGKGSFFDGDDEEAARANIAGHFMGNMAILSADGGNLSKDGYALKNATKADNGKYTNWLFTRHSKDQVRSVATNKLSEWKNIRESKGDSWIWYNNFTGWAVSNLKATGQL